VTAHDGGLTGEQISALEMMAARPLGSEAEMTAKGFTIGLLGD
jgi:hypothetical protein